MSQATITDTNERIFRRVVDGWNRNDPSVIDELVAEDCVLHDAPPGPAREVWKASFADMREIFDPIHTEIKHLVAAGNYVIAYETTVATQVGPFLGFASTDKSASVTSLIMVEIIDGQIVARWNAADMMSALIQLGHLTPG